MLVLLVLTGTTLAAALLVADGRLDDWAGRTPLAVDPAGDATGGDGPADVQGFYGAWSEDNLLVFRLDVTDVENEPPVAVAQAVTTLEDQSVQITLAGTDRRGSPELCHHHSAHTRGTERDHPALTDDGKGDLHPEPQRQRCRQLRFPGQ